MCRYYLYDAKACKNCKNSWATRINAKPKVGHRYYGRCNCRENVKGGQVEYRSEKAGIIYVGVGKASFKNDALAENIRALIDAIVKSKPVGAKGQYLKKMVLSSTMGVGVMFTLD